MARMAKRRITQENVEAKSNTTSEKAETKTVEEKKTFKDTDGVLCRSVTQGALFFIGSRTGIKYKFDNYGDEREIEYRDLVSAVRARSSFIFNPYFIIDDVDFINEFSQLKEFYKNNYSVTDLKSILKMPVSKIEKEINSLPKGAKESLKIIASTEIAEGRLDSIQKIKLLDKLLNVNLSLLSGLAN